MNAIDLLEKDHQGAKKVLGEISQLSGTKKKELFSALKHELETHDRIEEDIFYPAVLAHPNASALSAGDKAAHEAVETALDKLAGMKIDDPNWAPAFNAMQAKLVAHIKDEETNLFVKIRKALSPAELDALGVKMSAEKERLLKAA
jgi:iron-sulfur cluster repair protein YtfE (RIC family)